MKIHVDLSIRFRAWFITFYDLHKVWDEKLPIPVLLPQQTLINFNERGVQLYVALVAA